MKISLQKAQSILLSGGVVAIPTDTVYGLAAVPEHQHQLFELKGRSSDQKILLLYPDVESVLVELGPGFEVLAGCWPGPLSVVVGELGYRVPDHPVALQLLRETGPLAVTSANLSGEAPALNADEVEAIFGASFSVLEGECRLGKPSTIIAWQGGEWQLLRRGAIDPPPLPPPTERRKR